MPASLTGFQKDFPSAQRVHERCQVIRKQACVSESVYICYADAALLDHHLPKHSHHDLTTRSPGSVFSFMEDSASMGKLSQHEPFLSGCVALTMATPRALFPILDGPFELCPISWCLHHQNEDEEEASGQGQTHKEATPELHTDHAPPSLCQVVNLQ